MTEMEWTLSKAARFRAASNVISWNKTKNRVCSKGDFKQNMIAAFIQVETAFFHA